MTAPTPTRAEEAREADCACEHPTNETLERIGAFGRSCKIGKHQATNWVHLRATVDALDAAGQQWAADTLIWQVWHRVNADARHNEFYRIGLDKKCDAEARAARAEAEVARLTAAVEKAERERDAAKGANACWQVSSLAKVKEFDALLHDAREDTLAEFRRANTAEARVAVLEGALKPFAKLGALFGPRTSANLDVLIYGPAAGPEYNLTGDHLRAAVRALDGGDQ